MCPIHADFKHFRKGGAKEKGVRNISSIICANETSSMEIEELRERTD
jgi:hypothetical protein